jgi:hypothetical protein
MGRTEPEGGVCETPGGGYRPDATAWAATALAAAGLEHEAARARQRLARSQLRDGRVPLLAREPDVHWPTALALLAWQGRPAWEERARAARAFLLQARGEHWAKAAASPVGHDTALTGWAWSSGTHSWVEPTALAVLALRGQGLAEHPRVAEAVLMLLDRQLPAGGWNYGNVSVFGQQLLPTAEATGLALCALEGLVPAEGVERSLAWLEEEAEQSRAPLSLARALLALCAWGRAPADAGRRLRESLGLQRRYGPFATSVLCQMSLAALAAQGAPPLHAAFPPVHGGGA